VFFIFVLFATVRSGLGCFPSAGRSERDRANGGPIGSGVVDACDLSRRAPILWFLAKTDMATARSVTALLTDWSRGDSTALDQLLPLVYAELRRIAARQLRRERANHTLQPTALVHEVYLRLVDQREVDWQNRAHFLGVAARVMRRILVDHARRHGARKRGDGVQRVSIDEAIELAASPEMPVLAFDHALDRLEKVDSDLARIVELRAFGGLTIEEAAHVLKVSPSTAKRDWRTAKAWLNRELGSDARE
jgi:RNA polymerase sigma factor (TIGR02999 family)